MKCTVYFTILITLPAIQPIKIPISRVSSINNVSFRCEMKNEENTNVHCYGKTLMEIPSNLSRSLMKLSVTDAAITHVTRNSFDAYRKEMRDVTLSNLPYLRVIEDGTFGDMPNLRTLYISYSPQIRFLHGLLKGVTSHTFYSLDLDHNNIQTLPTNSIKVSAQQVTINFNPLKSVEDYAFNGSQIAELQMHSNFLLKKLGDEAFSGINSLRLLDPYNLSNIEYLSNPKLIYKEILKPLKGKALGHVEGKIIDTTSGINNYDNGYFHSDVTKLNETQLNTFCGNIVFRILEVECLPEADALNPCEDIMGMSWLRISVWCVVVLALLGNVAVIIVFLFSQTVMNVARFLIFNLAVADFCMGLYLFLIAAMDFYSVGQYFNFAFNWQYGIGCQIAGFLTVFSSHLSIYTLTIVTLERWFAITYAIHLTKRITIKCAMYILLGGWIYSLFVAILPIFGVNNYSSTSICLPMESKRTVDKIYLYTVIFINGSAFALIVFCYVQIYLSLGYETRRASTRGEMTIAKKMSLLIFVDFATVAPVAFFGLTALAGYPLIGVTKSKILLVFFYPLNACANPYLYALMTAQYRQDFMELVSRCKICPNKSAKQKHDSVPLSTPIRLTYTSENGSCVIHKNDVRVKSPII